MVRKYDTKYNYYSSRICRIPSLTNRTRIIYYHYIIEIIAFQVLIFFLDCSNKKEKICDSTMYELK